MAKRFKMSRKGSRKSFSKHGKMTHVKNTVGSSAVMRGGIRL